MHCFQWAQSLKQIDHETEVAYPQYTEPVLNASVVLTSSPGSSQIPTGIFVHTVVYY